MTSRILEGLKVLDLTRVVAGPWCTQLLADMGATVYKIEKPGEGDDTRRMLPFLKDAQDKDTNESAVYLACNRSKRSVTIDISQPEGAELVRKLAAACDVMIENYKAGSLRKYGLDHDSIRAVRPDIVMDLGYNMVSNSPFGIAGPKGMDPDVVKTLHDAFKKALEEPATQAMLEKLDQGTPTSTASTTRPSPASATRTSAS